MINYIKNLFKKKPPTVIKKEYDTHDMLVKFYINDGRIIEHTFKAIIYIWFSYVKDDNVRELEDGTYIFEKWQKSVNQHTSYNIHGEIFLVHQILRIENQKVPVKLVDEYTN